MSKIVTIGDIHGQQSWKKAFDISADKYVFVGDYMDSFWLLDNQIIENLWDIIQLKSENPESIVLLLGNHDIHYLYKPRFRCSGYRQSYASEVYRTLQMNKSKFQFAYQEQDFLWTHAGVSCTWLDDVRVLYNECEIRKENLSADLINEHIPSKYFADPEHFSSVNHPGRPLFWIGPIRGGREPSGGIFWADKRETKDDQPPINQVVGHSPVATITTHKSLDGKTRITYCDTLEHGDKSFHVMDI